VDPRELGAIYAAKIAREKAAQHGKNEVDALKSKAEKAASDKVINALTSVVLPYLEEAKSFFPNGAFDYRRDSDVNTKRLVSVSFQINGFDAVEIRDQGGQVAVRKTGALSQPEGAGVVKSTYPTDSSGPMIGSAEDLTREKLGKLIELVIKGG
jgi:hypothetical protein